MLSSGPTNIAPPLRIKPPMFTHNFFCCLAETSKSFKKSIKSGIYYFLGTFHSKFTENSSLWILRKKNFFIIDKVQNPTGWPILGCRKDYLLRSIFINVMAHKTTSAAERMLWVESGRCFICDRRKFMLHDCHILGSLMNFRPNSLTLLKWDGLVPRAAFSPRRMILSLSR